MDRVIFRKRKKDGERFAVFPDQQGIVKGSVIVYNPKLEESEEDYTRFMRETVKIPQSIYRSFKKILQDEGGFDLDVVKLKGRPGIDPERTEKRCPLCEEVLAIESFCKSRQGNDGRFSICKECSAVEMSARQLAKETDERLLEKIAHYKVLIKRIGRVRDGDATPREIAREERG